MSIEHSGNWEVCVQVSLLQNKFFENIFILRNIVQMYRLLVVDGGGLGTLAPPPIPGSECFPYRYVFIKVYLVYNFRY